MQITILTVGSRGDVQPFIALGLGLQQAGHKDEQVLGAATSLSMLSPVMGDVGFVQLDEILIQQNK